MIDVYTYRDILLPALGIFVGGGAVLGLIVLGIVQVVDQHRYARIMRESHKRLAQYDAAYRVRMNAFLSGVGPKP